MDPNLKPDVLNSSSEDQLASPLVRTRKGTATDTEIKVFQKGKEIADLTKATKEGKPLSSRQQKITIKYQEHWFALADFLVEVLKQRQLDIKQYSNLRSKPLELNSPDQQLIVDWIKKNNCRPLKNRMLYLLECLPILDSKEYLASLQEMQEDFETRTSHRQKRGVEKRISVLEKEIY